MKTKERGITLIALVVTIIVLLILAGVSIQMITGQSGILNQARQAKEETVKGQIRDNVRREILEKMTEKYGEDLTAKELKAILDNYFSDVPGLEEDDWKAENFPDSFPDLKSKEGGHTFKLGELYSGNLSGTKTGEVVPPTPEGPEAGDIVAVPEGKEWDDAKVNPTVDEKGNIIPVPEGFYYVGGAESGTDEEKDNIGVVISDVPEDDMENSKGGNQFVWVPVPNAIADDVVSGEATEVDLTDTELTPMAEIDPNNTKYYRGVLYDERSYAISDTAKTVKYRTYSATGCREPDVVTKYDGTASDPIQLTKAALQADYKEMVESVDKYGGFYVARYEMSLSNGNAQYKKGETSADASTAGTWYGLYDKQKEFATANGKVSVKSSMIWGSQYDAMMNWMARCGINIGGENSNLTGKTYNNTVKTGVSGDTDVLNNIYDLIGCHYEMTLEATYTDNRITRGGFYSVPESPSVRYNFATGLNGSYMDGSRASLYVTLITYSDAVVE